ncbi:hypothetical protein NC652_015856 [Populus alba x Populus x berolinensis]|nr:hypothetical protein NC652_015856 [Populus alba x Populus x berolinensis]
MMCSTTNDVNTTSLQKRLKLPTNYKLPERLRPLQKPCSLLKTKSCVQNEKHMEQYQALSFHFSFLSGEGKGNSMISGPRNLQ